jgi:hypothetical protein
MPQLSGLCRQRVYLPDKKAVQQHPKYVLALFREEYNSCSYSELYIPVYIIRNIWKFYASVNKINPLMREPVDIPYVPGSLRQLFKPVPMYKPGLCTGVCEWALANHVIQGYKAAQFKHAVIDFAKRHNILVEAGQ